MQIEVKNIKHIFNKNSIGEFKALDGVSAKIKQGEFISIIGQTGSGKTTFIEHLNALLLPTEGEVIIGERHIVNTKRRIKKIKQIRKNVGVVFQFAEYQLFEETILKDIIFGPINMGATKDDAIEKAKKYLKLVGLPQDYLERSPFQLSGGQKRRVALAGILAMEPDFLIFDEPTAGLDPQGEIEMYKIFKKLNDEGRTIIIVTHNLDHALEHSERVIIFNGGKILVDDKALKVLYSKKILEENDLEIPKLVSIVRDLEARGKKIGKVRNIKQLVSKLK